MKTAEKLLVETRGHLMTGTIFNIKSAHLFLSLPSSSLCSFNISVYSEFLFYCGLVWLLWPIPIWTPFNFSFFCQILSMFYGLISQENMVSLSLPLRTQLCYWPMASLWIGSPLARCYNLRQLWNTVTWSPQCFFFRKSRRQFTSEGVWSWQGYWSFIQLET